MLVYVFKSEDTKYLESYPKLTDMGDMGLYCLEAREAEWASLHKKSDGRALIFDSGTDYAVVELENIRKIVG